MTNRITLRQQLEAFQNGQIMAAEGQIDNEGCYNFYDWFCKQTSLRNKAIRLFGNLRTFLKHERSIDLDKHYVFFKNNCPFNGSLYDDFRICDCETNEVVWNVTPKSGHTGTAQIWGQINDFKEPYKEADTFRALFKA